MTAELSWHVQNLDLTGWLESITAKKILTTFYLVMSTSTVSETGPWSPIQYKDNEELVLSTQQWQWMVMRQTPIIIEIPKLILTLIRQDIYKGLGSCYQSVPNDERQLASL